MRAETPSWLTRMRTCRFLGEQNLFPRRCITSCGSTGRTECTPDTCRATLPRTAVSACPRNMQLRFSIPSVPELQSLFLAEPPRAVIGANRDPGFQEAAIDLQTRALAHVLIRALRHRHQCGGGKLDIMVAARATYRRSRWLSWVRAKDRPGRPGCSMPHPERDRWPVLSCRLRLHR
jgi:hypothetical protein